MSRSPAAHIERAVHALALDAAAADVARAFHAAGIVSLLLKGPAIVHWLYSDDPAQRTYTDADVLVSPAEFHAAENVLVGMGFMRPVTGYRHQVAAWVPESAWERPGAPPTSIDLHRGFHGVSAAHWESFWALMTEHVVRIDIGGGQVRIPDAAGCALVVALHESAAARGEQSGLDLRRAAAAFDAGTWQEAARRADVIGATPSFVLGLSLHEQGRAIVDALELAGPLPVAETTRSLVLAGADPDAVERAWSLQHQLAAADGWRHRLRVLFDIAFPSAAYLRATVPTARHGRAGMALARVDRLLDLTLRAPAILRLMRAGRRRRGQLASTRSKRA